MAKNHTRYRATIASPGMVTYYVYGRNLPRLVDRVLSNIVETQKWWKHSFATTYHVADNLPRSGFHGRPNWRLVDQDLPSPFCCSQPDHERTDMER